MAAAKRKKSKPAGSEKIGGYFASISLCNIRCFGPEQTLNLLDAEGNPARWTILLGDNGVGKTTVLQSLAAFVPTDTAELFRDGLPSSPGLDRLKTSSTLPSSVVHGFSVAKLVRAGFREHRVRAVLHYKNKLDSNRKDVAVCGETHDGYGVWLELPQRELSLCVGYGASRSMGSNRLSESKSASAFATLFDEAATLRNAEEWLVLSDYAASKESDPRKKRQAEAELRQVKDTLVALLPDVQDLRVELNEKPGGTPLVQARTSDGWVSLQHLSLGYRTTISWMVDLASRMFEAYPDSADPLAEPAVALVDEIDLHLHPRWQRELLGHLEKHFPNTQFIATAHSPLVVQAAPNANIAVLKREGDHVVIHQDAASIRGWRVDQILTSDLFGLPSARGPEQDVLRRRREKILGKARLTRADEAELKTIEAQLVDAPGGETPQQIDAMNVILRAAARLKAG